ncbi:hypothetical protein ASD23_00250 [Agromyces sp. Root1464]|nr:hypothetical protein ASD23_00250 [Agromyces sp. Root1464]
MVADEVLLSSVDLARRALLEVTAPETVGSVVGHLVEGEHVLTLLFASDLSGYPGWHWSVTLSRFDDTAEPTVLETELMPGESALLAPDWVPWSERLADYRAAQEAIAAASADDEADDDEADDDDGGAVDGDEVDEDDHDDDEHDVDDEFDGIDIDALGAVGDESDDDDESDDGDDDESDEDESDDDESDDESDDDDSDDDESDGQSAERSAD